MDSITRQQLDKLLEKYVDEPLTEEANRILQERIELYKQAAR